jgi:hypothetical protein
MQFITGAMRQHLHMLNNQQVDNIDAIDILAVVPQWLEHQEAPGSSLPGRAAKDDDGEQTAAKKALSEFQTFRQSARTETRNAANATQLSFDA